MKKILIVIGTRPEAIKMAPVLLALKDDPLFTTHLCITGQHEELVLEVLDFFQIHPDSNLGVMEDCRGDLSCLTVAILTKVKQVMEAFRPDVVLVQGDTTSAFAAALAAFYAKAKLGHVEAGLRTYDKENPFPEELNRVAISRMADFHFAPTEVAKANLLREKITGDHILVTGNTIVDALFAAKKRLPDAANTLNAELRKTLLVTIHRRENHGSVFEGICSAIQQLSEREDLGIVFILHPNANIYPVAKKMLGNWPHVELLEPQPYGSFLQLMLKSSLILTDSGGIQEEATVLGKPVLLVRKTTERPEAISAGIVKLIGTEEREIVAQVRNFMDGKPLNASFSGHATVYGDGKAHKRLLAFLRKMLL
ncbi:MAG: UDP-N-acetylglucosamine 2-epimerase (non-hydrolyzing) [Saprospiraceae bacterium]